MLPSGQMLSPALPQRVALRDEQLVLAAQAGSTAAFAELQNLHARHVYKSIVAITKNREDAEDALQDTFLRAYQALGGFEGRANFSSWLTRIGINFALMILRKRRARPEVSTDSSFESRDELPPFEVRDPGPNPEQIYDQRQRYRRVLHAICQLEPGLRAAMQIRLTRGSSLKEIAQALQITEAAVKARLHRARTRLIASKSLKHLGASEAVSRSPRTGFLPAMQQEGQPCLH